MALELVTHINDLVAENPKTDDAISQGDDHIKNIKTALLNDFGNISGTVTADQTDLNRTDITLEGTAEASKVLTADSSGYTTGAEFISPKVQTGINDTNGNELIKVTATASAVNEITVANAATGSNPVISATGGDANIGIAVTAKGTGGIDLNPGSDGVTIGTGNGIDGVLDEDNMATDSDTHLATQQSIKAYVDAAVAAITPSEITAQAYTGASTSYTFAHGLSREPLSVQVVAECTNAGGANSYSLGDRVIITDSSTGSGQPGVTAKIDATNVTLNIGDAILIVPDGGGNAAAMTVNSWKLSVLVS